MKINKLLILWASILCCFASCSLPSKSNQEELYSGGRDNKLFQSILNIQQTPRSSKDQLLGFFSDQGSWMGFTHSEDSSDIFGFCGPFSLRTYEWAAKSMVELKSSTGVKASSIKREYYPGIIAVTGQFDGGIEVSQELIFADSDMALIRFRSSKPLAFRLCITPMIGYETSLEDGFLKLSSRRETFFLVLPENIVDVSTQKDHIEFEVPIKSELIISLVHDRNGRDINEVKSLLDDGNHFFDLNKSRWDKYLQSVLRKEMPQGFDRIAVKSIVTLISNWVSPEGDLPYDGIIPSHAKGYFVGLWAWDTWKAIVSTVKFAPELSKKFLRSMLTFQDDLGMVADCVYPDSLENNWRNTKAPLASWATDAIYEVTKDTVFLAEVFPQLVKYHNWWYNYRDVNKNGICEYGSTDGTRVAAAWESGMDNAVRFDNANMLTTKGGQSSLDQESVDLNAFLIQERALLQKFSLILGTKFEEQGMSAQEFADYFYDPVDDFFYDRRITNGEFIRVKGCEAYAPLWTELNTSQQLDRMLPILMDSTKFATFVPFPTLVADHPNFTYDGYWRGPIWVDQVYFAISGLRKNGQKELANSFTKQLFYHLDGAVGDGPLCENYDPLTGEQLQARHFTWTAAHLLMLYDEYEL